MLTDRVHNGDIASFPKEVAISGAILEGRYVQIVDSFPLKLTGDKLVLLRDAKFKRPSECKLRRPLALWGWAKQVGLLRQCLGR
jgi:hypothetical protein